MGSVIDVNGDRNATWVSFLGPVLGSNFSIYYSVAGIPLCRAGAFIYCPPNTYTRAFRNSMLAMVTILFALIASLPHSI